MSTATLLALSAIIFFAPHCDAADARSNSRLCLLLSFVFLALDFFPRGAA